MVSAPSARTATDTGVDAPEKRVQKYDFFEFNVAAGNHWRLTMPVGARKNHLGGAPMVW